MHKAQLLAFTAILTLSGAAIAQTAADEPVTKTGIGAEVSVLAKGQRDAETKGLGTQVRELAKAQRPVDEDETEDADDAVEDDAEAEVAVTGRANASDKSAAVLSADVAAAKGEANSLIKDGTGPVATLRDSRSAASDVRQNSSDARNAASENRATAAEARASAQTARESASAARETAQTIRDTVRNARPGRGN